MRCLIEPLACPHRRAVFCQRTGDKRASVHNSPSFFMWGELNYNRRCTMSTRMKLLIPAKERRLLGNFLLRVFSGGAKERIK
jgi:hypothetical protein